jgi:phage shock protein A
MGLFKRIGDIVSANLNEMVESYEDPETMLKQAVREMEASIETARRDVAKSMAQQKMLSKQLAENERQAEQWQQRAESAVESGDDNLARKALVRKQEHDKIVDALRDQHAASSESSQTLRRQLEAMQAKLADAKRRIGTLTARRKAAAVRSRAQLCKVDPQWNDDAFAKFDRLREKVEMAEAEADALRELCGEASLVAQPHAENHQFDVELEAELLQLKRKLNK